MARFDVDYPYVRDNADIVAVLAHYDVQLKGDGEQRKGLCPFHDDTKPSLNVNIAKNVFKCHACGIGGNIIKMVQLLDDGLANPRRAALRIAELSGIAARPGGEVVNAERPHLGEMTKTSKAKPKMVGTSKPTPTAAAQALPDTADREPFNKPLTFELKLAPVAEGGDTTVHKFIEARGLPYDRLEELGIGLSARGSMTGRLAIPIKNKNGELVAYCGRNIGLLEDENEPKYKFPEKFRKDLELYGWDTAQAFDHVVIVESFLSVIRHGGVAARVGFGLVSVMGTTISEAQVALLAEAGSKVTVCFDGDQAGLTGARVVTASIAQAGLWVTDCSYSNGSKPHQDSSEAFCRRLGTI